MRRLLFAACLLAPPAAARAVDPIPYLPAQTDAVVTVDVKRVAESDLGKKHGAALLRELLDAYKPAAAVVKASGLDPLRDFDVITVGIPLDKATAHRPFALFEGKFDARKVQASLTAYTTDHKELSVVTVGGRPAYKLTGGKPGDTMFAAVLDDAKVVVAPSEKDLEGAFAAAAGGRKPVISKELTWVLGAKSPAPIFARAWVRGKFKGITLPNDKLQAAVQGIEWVSVSVGVTKDVTVTAVMNTVDEAAAQKLSDLLGAAIGLVRLQVLAAAEDQPELRPISDLLKATRVSPNGKTVVASGSVKGEAIDRALAPPPAPKAPVVPKKK